MRKRFDTSYYTPEEVANILKVRKHTVWNWLREGSLKGIKIHGKMWRIPIKELDDFIYRNEKEKVEWPLDPAPIKGTPITNNIAQMGGARK